MQAEVCVCVSSLVVLEIGLGFKTILKTTFQGLGLVSDSEAFLFGLVSVSDWVDSPKLGQH